MRPATRKLPKATSIWTERINLPQSTSHTAAYNPRRRVVPRSKNADDDQEARLGLPSTDNGVPVVRTRSRTSTLSPIRSSLYLHLHPLRASLPASSPPAVTRQSIRTASHAAAIREHEDEEDDRSGPSRWDNHYSELHAQCSSGVNRTTETYGPFGDSAASFHSDTIGSGVEDGYEFWYGVINHRPYPFHLEGRTEAEGPGYGAGWSLGQPEWMREDMWAAAVEVGGGTANSAKERSSDANRNERSLDSNTRLDSASISEGIASVPTILEETPLQGFSTGQAGRRRAPSSSDKITALTRKAIVAGHATSSSSDTSQTRWHKIKEELRLPYEQANGIRMCLMSRFRTSGRPGLHLVSFFSLMDKHGERADWDLLVGHIEKLQEDLGTTTPKQGDMTAGQRTSAQLTALSVQARMGQARITRGITFAKRDIGRLARSLRQPDVIAVLLPALTGFCTLADSLGQGVEADRVVIRHLGKLVFLDMQNRRDKALKQQEASFRDLFYRRLSEVPDALLWHQEVIAQSTSEGSPNASLSCDAASLMVDALGSAVETSRAATDFADAIHERGVALWDSVASALWRAAARLGEWDSALRIYHRQCPSEGVTATRNHIYQQGIELLTGAGQLTEALELTEQLLERKQPVHQIIILQLMTAVKTARRSKEALALAELAYPSQMRYLKHCLEMDCPAEEDRDNARDLYSRVLSVYAADGNMNGVNMVSRAITSMQRELTVVDYNLMLELFARRHNVQAGLGVHMEMSAAGVEPDSYTINALARLCSQQQEPEAAEALYRKAKDFGISLHPIAVNTVMNAQIEAGNYREAMAVWRGLDAAEQMHRSIMTTLIKAMVRLGAPQEEVRRTILHAFGDLAHAPIRCWTLLIMSVCDSGNMKEAQSLYTDLAMHEQSGHPELKVNVYAASVLMAAYLRQDALTSAVTVYYDLIARGIQPSAITNSIIAKAISEAKWPVAEQLDAVKFVDGLMAGHDSERKPRHQLRQTEVETLITPLILAGGRNMDVGRATRWYQRALKHEGETLNLRIALLDANAKAGRTEDVKADWRSILSMVAGARTGGTYPDNGNILQGSAVKRLRIPLSIFVNSMSEAGQHEEVDRAWHGLISAGLIPDAHNWNHILIAHLRAGRVEEAFRICEDVLVPVQREVSTRQIRSMRPAIEHTENAHRDPSESELLSALDVPPRGSTGRRRYTDAREGKMVRLYLRRERRAEEEEYSDEQYAQANGSRASKFRSSMALLDRWRPRDVGKAPFASAVAALDHVYREMELGRPVLRVAPRNRVLALVSSDDESDVLDAPGRGGLEDSTDRAHLEADIDDTHQEASGGLAVLASDKGVHREERMKQNSGPLALLAKIDRRYARTVSLISLYRRKRQGGGRSRMVS